MARPVFGGNSRTSNPTPGTGGGSSGTLGGRRFGPRPGSVTLQIGDEKYLWLLVILEVVAMGAARNHFRRHHGG